jgi:hypothetical protein
VSRQETYTRFEAAKARVPCRLNLQDVYVTNFGDVAESRINSGYTVEEIKSGVTMLTPLETLEQWQPANPRSVALNFGLHIGWDNDIGSDFFDIYVVSNDLRAYFPRSSAQIYVDTFDWDSLLLSILNILKKCERDTWDASVNELRKRFKWEYEGMAGT